jgi:erythromycin esterase-like protein
LSVLARATLDELRLAAQPLTDGEAGDYDALLKLIGKARLVLLGATCQGTHEFFLGWLRNYNDRFEGDRHKVRVGGLDIDSLTKTVVWAHSREVGDARATDQSESTIGQMARERHGRGAVLINFTTYKGRFVAANANGTVPHRHVLPPAPPDCVEAVCHALEIPRFYLPLRGAPDRLAEAPREPRLARMVDSVYRADTTSDSYLRARLVDHFDALVHFDATRPREPIDPNPG